MSDLQEDLLIIFYVAFLMLMGFAMADEEVEQAPCSYVEAKA